MPAYKIKAFPAPFDAPRFQEVAQSCAFILTANWCMQGIRGMDSKELGFRLLLELLVAAVLQDAVGLPAALVLAHSFSFILNGQVWVCVRYCPAYRRSPRAVDKFERRTANRLRRLPWLEEAVLIGSRGGTAPRGTRSDIDLRLVFPPGPLAWLRTNLLLLRLRAAVFVRMIPLDLYAYDGVDSLRRFDQREPLRLILDRQGRLAAAFPARVTR
jgi:hypothetical protein